MRFLVRMLPTGEGGPTFLANVRSLAKSVMTEARNPKWTSYGALELDVFTKSTGDFALFLAAVEPLARIEFSRDLNVAPGHRPKDELIDEARSYFNSERFWEAHEALETVWRGSEGDEKTYLQGLILVCAAFVHHQKGEGDVALRVLRRAAGQLSFGASRYFDISVENTKNVVSKIIETGKFEGFRL